MGEKSVGGPKGCKNCGKRRRGVCKGKLGGGRLAERGLGGHKHAYRGFSGRFLYCKKTYSKSCQGETASTVGSGSTGYGSMREKKKGKKGTRTGEALWAGKGGKGEALKTGGRAGGVVTACK